VDTCGGGGPYGEAWAPGRLELLVGGAIDNGRPVPLSHHAAVVLPQTSDAWGPQDREEDVHTPLLAVDGRDAQRVELKASSVVAISLTTAEFVLEGEGARGNAGRALALGSGFQPGVTARSPPRCRPSAQPGYGAASLLPILWPTPTHDRARYRERYEPRHIRSCSPYDVVGGGMHVEQMAATARRHGAARMSPSPRLRPTVRLRGQPRPPSPRPYARGPTAGGCSRPTTCTAPSTAARRGRLRPFRR